MVKSKYWRILYTVQYLLNPIVHTGTNSNYLQKLINSGDTHDSLHIRK